MTSNKITPIILAGGAGTRLWPVSREESPKQFCRLLDGQSLFQATAKRVSDPALFNAPIIVTGAQYAGLAEQQLAEYGLEASAIVCEPMGRDTAPAIAAALAAARPGPVAENYLVLPSDHAIEDDEALKTAIRTGRDLIRHSRHLVTFGIAPSRPDTGFGYIRAERDELRPGVHAVSRFIEKPDAARAANLIREAGTSWNAGIFLFNGRDMLDELERHAPELLYMVRKSLANGTMSGSKVFPDAAAFAKAPKLSIDYAVMEHTERAAVVPVDPGWSDLGAWSAIWERGESDVVGNVLEGDAIAVNSTGSLVRTDGPTVAIAGVDDLVVVANRDAVLVARKDDAQSVKTLVETMKAEDRVEQKRHAGEDRPWGRFDSIDRGEHHQVKRIRVHPGGRLSLQYHHHRSEHWVVVSGTAQVTVGDNVMALGPCEQVFIPQGEVHRLENLGSEPVEIIEVQYGDYLGEDDIVRVEDVYGREAVPAALDENLAAA
ncbi:MAG: mannose-1-phosphate guanylyltransferase/mannose-6-phosphate isomerase [Pseudomonadota bacterium]